MLKFPNIFFPNSGWCNELNVVYKKGYYKPRNKAEFDAFSKIGKALGKVVEIEEPEWEEIDEIIPNLDENKEELYTELKEQFPDDKILQLSKEQGEHPKTEPKIDYDNLPYKELVEIAKEKGLYPNIRKRNKLIKELKALES